MLKGLRAEIMYFKKTLDKIGVTVDVEHAGKYKDFGDMFTRADMSPETREVITALVDDLYGNMVDRIAAARKKTPDQVRAIIDQGPFTATQALKAGLVDEIALRRPDVGRVEGQARARTSTKVPADKYSEVPLDTVGLQGAATSPWWSASGDIVRGDPGDDGADKPRSLLSDSTGCCARWATIPMFAA